MRDEIRRYLDEHGATYTPDALRRGLLSAGYDAAEVDAALGEWGSVRRQTRTDDRRRYGRWSLLIFAATLAVVFGTTVLLIGADVGLAAIGAVILFFSLLIAWGISALLGLFTVPRLGLGVALAVPVVLSVGLGGTCLAIMDGMTPTRPLSGTVDLQIDTPAFTGSGAADCFVGEGGTPFSIGSQQLGTLDGRNISVHLDSVNTDALMVAIALFPETETEPGWTYGTIFSTQLSEEIAADGLSGTVTFEGLSPEQDAEPGVVPTDPISGTISWTCERRP